MPSHPPTSPTTGSLARSKPDGALGAAAEAGRTVELHKLLQALEAAGVLSEQLHAADASGAMPLHRAVFAGHTVCVQLLVGARADVDAGMGGSGARPLQIVAALDSYECVQALIGMRASLSAADASGASALHAASACGHERVAMLLLGARAQVNAVDAAGATPLVAACAATSPACVAALLDSEADPNAAHEGATPLMWCVGLRGRATA